MSTYQFSGRVIDCTFFANRAGTGGAVRNFGPNPVTRPEAAAYIRCRFNANHAPRGGAIENSFSQPMTLANCTFESNQANGANNVFNGGGAIYNDASRLIAVNCLFTDNDSDSVGGAINIKWSLAGVQLTNCTFAKNKAKQKKGADIYLWDNTRLTVTNCVAWSGGGTTIDRDVNGHITVTHSCVLGGYDGANNIKDDPRFMGGTQTPFALSTGSPCINAGNSYMLPADGFDLDGDSNTNEPIPLDLNRKARQLGVVDIGAFESQQK